MDRAHASGSGDEMFVFPSLEVYNSSGLLVYTSTNSTRNVKMLQNLSDGLRHFQPVPAEMPLVKLVEAFPEFQAREEELLRGHHPAVVSVDLAGCEGCSIQAEALDAMKGELREQSFNLLLIHVRQP